MESVDLLRTNRTYKTRENAVKALEAAIAKCGDNRIVRYVVATNAEGRFAPVVIGNQFIDFAMAFGFTVVS